MIVHQRKGAVELPGSGPATRVLVRDSNGNLAVLCVELPGGALIISRAGDEDFEWNARNHGVPLLEGVGNASSGIVLG